MAGPGKPGRKSHYDWDDKRDICYKLYVEQGLNITAIIEHFSKHFDIPISELPPNKHFQRRFKQWGFPARLKRLSADTEAAVLERIREMFAQNLAVWQMLDKLKEEGWDMDEYHLRALRKKHGMLVRIEQQGYGSLTEDNKRKRSGDDVGENDGEEWQDEVEEASPTQLRQPQPLPLGPDVAARRAQHLAEVQMQSDHLLQTRKRRRRIRGYGHLPADPAGMEPRYKSETSLDECKAYLHLPNELYAQMRTQYEAICRDMGIVKMTLCEEGQWQASKDRLVRENVHLSSVLHPLQPNIDKRTNALNVICSDVTKRMRNMDRQMTIADANNVLGLDPARSKDHRRLLYEILEADQFMTVSACGSEHLEALHQQWYTKSDVLQRALAEGDPQKAKAVKLLSRDVRKRYCDDQVRKDPSKKQWQRQKHYGPGPGPANNGIRIKKGRTVGQDPSQQTTPKSTRNNNRHNNLQTLVPLGPAWEGIEVPEFRTTTIADVVPQINFDLDPLLSNTTHGPPWPPQSYGPSQPCPSFASIPSYFRLAPESQLIGHHPKMWLGKLAGPTVEALRKAATSKTGAARVVKAHGIVKNADGSEDRWLIESDDELTIYLEEVGEKATFTVLLEGGYA